jgi:hypothetical protein
MTTTFIPTIGIRLGTDPYFQDGHTPQHVMDKIVDHAGRCEDCQEFWIYGGYRDFCIDCV